MSWQYVAIPKVFKRTSSHLTILYVLPDRSGQFAIVRVPHSAVRQRKGSVWQIQSHIADHIARYAKRYEGVLRYHDAYRATYVYGPIQGRYFGAMGEVSVPFPTSPEDFA